MSGDIWPIKTISA